MPERTDVIYTCDDSLWGILCCVFESYTRRELVTDILPEGTLSLFPTYPVQTVEEHALRVYHSLERISNELCAWVEDAWFSCAPDRAICIYRFIRMAYQWGAPVLGMLAEPAVCAVYELVRTLRNEVHLMNEFLRFTEYNGALVSEIEPKCITLPRMQAHFTGRFPEETFLIFDRAHGLALFYRPYEWSIQEVEELQLPPLDEAEKAFQRLWKCYYESIAIQGRYNPACRMGHMPKRFWKHLTELSPKMLAAAAGPQVRQLPCPVWKE
ncbi:MAG: DNA metabolism protein [Anaerotruncus sp.]|nr:DNA metabolism protein [Anaerotruncus sp.]